MPSPLWHAVDAESVVQRLDSDAATGLTPPAVARRRAEFGPNALPEDPRPSAARLLLHQFKSPLIYILFGAAALSAALRHWADAAVIFGVVLANALIGAYQERRAEVSMAALRRLAELQVRVLRDGREQPIAARDLVPGDLLLLAAGDAVGADARLLEAAALTTAEAALTGESAPVTKQAGRMPEATALADRHNMVFSGTLVTAGHGRAVVTATGTHTEVGAIARLTQQTREPKTPLELRLAGFGRQLVVAALVLFIAVMAFGMLRGMPLVELLMVAISQTVSMVPEGLPVAMTIALAVGSLREDGHDVVAGDPAVRALFTAAVLCNDAELLPPNDGGAAWRVLGDPTEGALLVAAAKAGTDVQTLRAARPRCAEIPFDSDTRMMATSHAGESAALFVKGAPEAVLRLCTTDPLPTLQAARAAAEAMAQRAMKSRRRSAHAAPPASVPS